MLFRDSLASQSLAMEERNEEREDGKTTTYYHRPSYTEYGVHLLIKLIFEVKVAVGESSFHL